MPSFLPSVQGNGGAVVATPELTEIYPDIVTVTRPPARPLETNLLKQESTLSPAIAPIETRATLTFVIDHAFGQIPVQYEIETVIQQISLYYADLLSASFDGFESMAVAETGSVSEKRGFITLTHVAYFAKTSFVQGSTSPSTAEVEAAIDGASYGVFFADYIPSLKATGNIFGNTISVTTSIGTSAPTSVTDVGTTAPTKVPGGGRDFQFASVPDTRASVTVASTKPRRSNIFRHSQVPNAGRGKHN